MEDADTAGAAAPDGGAESDPSSSEKKGLSAKNTLSFPCPKCGEETSAPRTAAGRKRKCVRCRKRILVPGELVGRGSLTAGGLAERNLYHEAHIKALAIVSLLGTAVAFLGAAIWALGPRGNATVVAVTAGTGVVWLVVGLGLFKLTAWGRLLGILYYGLYLIGGVCGAPLSMGARAPGRIVVLVLLGVFSVFALWALVGHPANKMVQAEYKSMIAAPPPHTVRWWSSRVFMFGLPFMLISGITLVASAFR